MHEMDPLDRLRQIAQHALRTLVAAASHHVALDARRRIGQQIGGEGMEGGEHLHTLRRVLGKLLRRRAGWQPEHPGGAAAERGG